MQPHKRNYVSAPQAHAANGRLTFHGWVPRRGPMGGRVVIDGFELIVDATDLTVAGTAVEGEDVYRIWKRIKVQQVGGRERWNLTGDESRVALYHLEGAERVREHADIAIAANQSLTFSCYIPMSKRFLKRPIDTALPAELFHQLVIECGDTGEIGVGGGTVTIAAATYRVVARTHEEFEVELKAEDEVKAQLFTNTGGVTLKVGGRLQDLVVFARGANGGAAMANFTSVRIPELLPDATVRDAELQRPFLRDRFNVENGTTDGASIRNEPVAGDLAVPIIWCDADTSVFDGPIMDDVALFTVNTVASCIAIFRAVKPRSGDVETGVSHAWGLPPAAFRMKTVGKSKRNPAQWDHRKDERAYMPMKAPLPQKGR